MKQSPANLLQATNRKNNIAESKIISLLLYEGKINK